ncbi:MAG: tRNA threonylcarbamoyladenosine dehydratase, partial [Clostridiales bacterium]|nr:tRNA threonylcarbamoyladenosine dehydratase [Clostridiales bacterium]
MHEFDRTIRLVGEEGQARLLRAKVALFGLGGVGSYALEALVRAGIGEMLLVDGDVVEETNLNRQLIATRATLGQPKSEVARARALSIRPDMVIDARHAFYDAQTTGQFDLSRYDWVVDAIDTVSSKLLLIEQARAAGAKVISCMGAGNKLYTEFEIADIEKTSVCPLARRMRTELKKRGIQGVLAVYSKEPPLRPQDGERAPASISYVPGAAGLTLAGAVIRDLLGR